MVDYKVQKRSQTISSGFCMIVRELSAEDVAEHERREQHEQDNNAYGNV